MSGNQTDGNKCLDFSYDRRVFTVLYLLMFPIALLLNGVAAWVSVHLKSNTTFVVYLKNLVVADLILTLTNPIVAVSKLPNVSNRFYVLSCSVVSVIFYSTQYACIAFLGLISLDRFAKIITPRSKLFGQNLVLSKVISVTVWLTLFVFTVVPNIILSNRSSPNMTEIRKCMETKGPAGLYYHERIVIFLNVFFWFVSVVIAVCYIRIANKVIQSFRNSGSSNKDGNQKITLRVFLVVIVFFVLFGPYHIVRIPYTFQQVSESSITYCSYLRSKFAKEFTLWFATTNICMDPLLYVFLCREFKEQVVSLMKHVSLLFQKARGSPTQIDDPQTTL